MQDLSKQTVTFKRNNSLPSYLKRISNLTAKSDMTQPSSPTQTTEQPDAVTNTTPPATPPAEPQASYVKLAMRNMVRKRGTSLKHFFLTTFALLGILVGLSYLTR